MASNETTNLRVPDVLMFDMDDAPGSNFTSAYDQAAWNSSDWWSDGITAGPANGTLSAACDSHIVQYRIVPALICASCFLFGIVYCFFGYRFFKATMFITGFLFGTCIVYFFLLEQPAVPEAAKLGASFGTGLLCGLVGMLVLRVGLFLTGCTTGVLLTVAAFVVTELFYHMPTRWVPIGCALGAAVLVGLLTTFLCQKALVVAGTALLGSVMILSAVDYFVDLFRASLHAYFCMTARGTAGWEGDETFAVAMCWFSWILFAAWPVLFMISIVIQWRLTANDVDHPTSGSAIALPKTGNRRQGTGTSALTQQDKYRHLYKVRRSNGDVVSKSYMQSIHSQLSPSLRLLTPPPPSDINADDNSVMLTQTGDADQ